jgi:hypothetical protein
MAKELPYFKFEPNQWDNGIIHMCTHTEKGVFTDLCSMYWSRLGDVPYKLAVQKICGGNATALDSLYENKIIDVIDGNIYIKFLSEQLNEFDDISKQNSKNAKEGWEKRRKQRDGSERNATASNPQCENDAIREDKRRENEIKEINFNSFWEKYPTKVSKKKCQEKWHKLNKTDIDKILETIDGFVNYKPFENYTHPNPLTYLNQERWNDEINVVSDKTNQLLKPVIGTTNQKIMKYDD